MIEFPVLGWGEQIGFDSVFDYRDFFGRNAPVVDQVLFEGGSDDDDPLGALVEESRDLGKGCVQQRIFASCADRDQRFGPEVADFEDERYFFGKGEPPGGEGHQ